MFLSLELKESHTEMEELLYSIYKVQEPLIKYTSWKKNTILLQEINGRVILTMSTLRTITTSASPPQIEFLNTRPAQKCDPTQWLWCSFKTKIHYNSAQLIYNIIVPTESSHCHSLTHTIVFSVFLLSCEWCVAVCTALQHGSNFFGVKVWVLKINFEILCTWLEKSV